MVLGFYFIRIRYNSDRIVFVKSSRLQAVTLGLGALNRFTWRCFAHILILVPPQQGRATPTFFRYSQDLGVRKGETQLNVIIFF